MISPIIHQLWIGTAPLPDLYRQWSDQWQTLHPGWEYHLWTESNLPPLINQPLWDRAATISPDAPEQFRSDVARYEILYRHGGVWVDMDFEPRRSIDPLCSVPAFVAWEVQDRWASNAIMGATPGHPFIKELIDRLPASVRRNRGRANTKKTGPQYLTPILRHYPGVNVYDQAMFFPYAYNELDRASEDFPDAYGVHHFANQRRKRNRPL